MDPTIPLGTQELSQACGGTLLMWQRTGCSAPILTNFLPFSPSSSLCGATLKARSSQSLCSKCRSNSMRSKGNSTKVEKRHATSRSDSLEVSHLFGPAISTGDSWNLGGTPCLCSTRQSFTIVEIWTQRCGTSRQKQ